MGGRAESCTAGTNCTPAKRGLSDQSVQSTGMALDAGVTASSGVLNFPTHKAQTLGMAYAAPWSVCVTSVCIGWPIQAMLSCPGELR